MLKKISNIGDCGITCDFGDEVNKKTNKEVIKLFNFIRDSVISKKINGIKIMNFVKIKKVNQSLLKDSQQEQHNNEMYINLDQIISFEYHDLDIKNSKSEDQKYYQIILKYSKGAVLDFIVIKKYFYKIKTVLDINSV